MKKIKPENITQEDWDAVDSPSLPDSLLAIMKPVRETHPGMPSRVRGPQKVPVKKPISLRLDASVIDAFRSTGRGWQARMNTALHEWLHEHNRS